MTLPRIPGLWDEISGDVEKLAKTITRSVNPHFDNQLALAQMLREDPTKRQAMIDLEALNPGTLEQMYGKKVASNFLNKAPSVAASTERAGRNLVGKTPEQIKPTFENQAAQSAAGVQNATQVAQAEATLDATTQQTEYYRYQFDQKKFEDSMKNPDVRRRYDMLEEERKLVDVGLLNVSELAKNTLRGFTDNETLELLAADRPEAYELYKKFLDLYATEARDDRQEARSSKEWNRMIAREDNVAKRQAMMLANQTSIETGRDRNELFNYFMGEGELTPTTQRMFEENRIIKTRKARMEALSKFDKIADGYLAAEDGPARDIKRNELEFALREVFGAPITVKKVDDTQTVVNFWDKKNVYVLPSGEEVNGEMLYSLSTNPAEFEAMTAARAAIFAVTDLAQLEAIEKDMRSPTSLPTTQEGQRALQRDLNYVAQRKRELGATESSRRTSPSRRGTTP